MLFDKFKIKKLKEQEQRTNSLEQTSSEKSLHDIAVIGISGRFPEASNYSQFWENIKSGKNSTREIPKDRWDWKKYYQIDGKIKNRFVSHWGCFMNDIDQFDLRFFKLSQREADAMDPQQRILLEEAWSCFEDAGICPSKIAGSNTGVYIAGCQYDYRDLLERNQEIIVPHSTLGVANSLLANRISYFYDLKGPSISLDTACAGTLTSVHYGVEALQNHQCEMALVGGVNMMLSPNNYIRLSKMQVLSQTGELRSLDEKADGYIRGEGAGLLLLKPLEKALNDGDMVYGIIKGTAVNHSGRTKSISFPSPDAQASVIVEAVKKANVPVDTISYVELHGTGTPKGDPIEVEGLKKAFEQLISEDKKELLQTQFCGIGSVKTNVGHLEGAAGIPSIFKVLLAMKHHQLPPTLNYKKLNPEIKIENSPFYVANTLKEWNGAKNQSEELPLRAGISSFGLGGTNAHLVLEEFKDKRSYQEQSLQYVIICLSSKTEQGLLRNVSALSQFLNQQNDVNIQDISYTLSCCRDHFDKRIAFVVDSVSELRQKCRQFIENNAKNQNHLNVGSDTIHECIENLKRQELLHHSQEYKDILERIAQFYMSGIDFGWEQLYEEHARKIHLPTYSFEPTKCFIPDATTLIDNVLPLEEPVETESFENIHLYEETWVESNAPSCIADTRGTLCLILPEDYELQNELKTFVKEYKQICILCKCGNGYEKFSETNYQICSTSKVDYQTLFQEIKKITQDDLTVVNLLPLGKHLHKERYEEMLYLLQSLSENHFHQVNFYIAGCYETMLERCYLESWIGYERTEKLAFRSIHVKMLIANKNDYDNASIEQLFVHEIRCGFPESVLYENEKRSILKIEQVQFESKDTILRKHGSYMITGGTGGLGAMVATYLLKQYDAHLYLIGRSDESKKQSVLEKLKKIGGTVNYIQADVSDIDQMTIAVNKMIEAEGRVDGVIHAAGIYQGHKFIEKDQNEFYATLAPKISGTITIENAMQGKNYDFICYFSSISSVIGDMGDCDYSIANRFMKAYANVQNQFSHKKHVVINWPIWENGGMELGTPEAIEMYLKSSGQKLLTDTLGMEVFERCLSQNKLDFTVIHGSDDILKPYQSLKDNQALNQGETTINQDVIEEQNPSFDIDQLENNLIEDLKEMSSSILNFNKNEIHLESNFSDIGYDSVNLMDFAESLSQKYSINIQPDVFFRYPNIKQLTGYLLENYQTQLEQVYQIPKQEDKVEVEIKIDETKAFSDEKEPLAIIGMSGLFPGANSVEDLWNILSEGREVIQEIPKSRIEFPANEDRSSKGIPWRMGMLSDPSQFDPRFFEISPGEAEEIDPRQRMLMEETWKALEDAQLGEVDLSNSVVGTFVGVEDGDYRLNTGDEVRITSNHTGILAARLAYYLNFKGACIAINTACSSGLTALHQACLSLRNDDCDIAVVAGASLVCRPETYLGMTRSGMIAVDGECYAFDKRASGMIPGEAIAVIVLRRLSVAEREKNHIYAKILGTGINYDGKTNGITAPNGKAQADLYRKLYRKLGISSREIEYIVSHGTGTKLGDPIEMNALDEVFREDGCAPASCAITSVKPNIGHTLAASGIVSLISLVMAMKHRTIPASIHCEQPSNFINWNQSPFYVNTEKKVWNSNRANGLLGAVSSFGVSGTNVHVVLESYDKTTRIQPKEMPYYLLLLSAKSQKSLLKKLHDMEELFQQKKDCNLAEVSYALMDGRFHFNHRCALLVRNVDEAIRSIQDAIQGKTTETVLMEVVDLDFCENRRINEQIAKKQQMLRTQRDRIQVREDYIELMKYYGQGYRILGKEIFGDKLLCQIKLPYYPFENQSYWFKSTQTPMGIQQECNQIVSNDESPAEKVEDRLLKVVWQQEFRATTTPYDKLQTLVLYTDDKIRTALEGFDYELQFCKQQTDSNMFELIQQMNDYKHIKHFILVVKDVRVSQDFDGQDDTLLFFFRFVKAMIELGYDQKDIHLSIVTRCGQMINNHEVINAWHSGMDGFACVLSKEIPNWNVRVYDIDDVNRIPIETILSRSFEVDGEIHAYRNGSWYSQALVSYQTCPSKLTKYKQEGVYVVIGGAGGIGYLWSEYMISNYNAQIIWIGRSELNDTIDEKIRTLSLVGKRPEYIRGDVTNLASLSQAYQEIKSMYGQIHGIVHSAVGAFDKGIVSMQEEEFHQVLSVKTDGVQCINAVFGQEPLDFVLYFSSLSSFEKTRGQSGYTAGCCFIDAYAQQLQRQVPYTVRTINWGFWGNVGAGKRMPESIQISIGRTGARALDPKKAMEVVEQILCEDIVQFAYTRSVIQKSSCEIKPETNAPKETSSELDIRQKCLNKVTSLLSSVLKIPVEEFNANERLERYGLDSITILQLIREFQKVFEGLDSTIFYECSNINEITDYIIDKYQEELSEILIDAQETKISHDTKVNETVMIKNQATEPMVSYCDEPIAIIGMSGKFPKAENLDDYWENIKNGVDCVTEVPNDRWDLSDFYNPDIESAIKNQQSYCKYGGFIDGYAEFDPKFFKISPAEALTMDPQERHLLEQCWKTFENAGYTKKKIQDRYQGNIGVFVGITRTGFDFYGPELWKNGEQPLLGTSFSAMSNRISYVFNLSGPCMSIDTMCSSSLTALHEACEHIRRGDCEMSLLASANIYTHSATYKQFCQKRMLSPKGRCFAFSAQADGFIPGEGVAAVLLKPLSKAIKDHDQIHCVIRSTAVNHCGKTSGFTVPNPNAQKEMILKALKKANLSAEDISYVEAHGTGTKLGDPIEITGLTKAYRQYTDRKQYCSIGSVKTNIGHCEAASGLAGVLKVALQMKNQMLAPSLFSEELNPLIDFKNSPFYVQEQLTEWKRPIVCKNGTNVEGTRIAAVSSFGAGGSNAHVIMEEYTE